MGISDTYFRSSIGQDLQYSHDLLLSQFPDETGERQSACGGRGGSQSRACKCSKLYALCSLLLMHSSAPWVTWRNNAQLLVFIGLKLKFS